MSYEISCHMRFHVILDFMLFDISCDLSDLIHHSNHFHESHHCINAQSCYREPVCSQKVVKIVEVMREDYGGYA